MLDLGHAIRSLRRSPTFAATAVATLALGIGATSAIFTIVNAALFKQLPYPNPEELVVLDHAFAAGDAVTYVRDQRVSEAFFVTRGVRPILSGI